MSPIDFSRSRAILVGTARYTHGLDQMEAAHNSLTTMKDLLTGPLCRWPSERVEVFEDRTTRDGLNQEIAKLIHESTDVLLFYYVGHGQLLDGEHLGMALVDTHAKPEMRHSTSLRLDDLRTELKYRCSARAKLVILDCCFSGIATRNIQGPGLADQVRIATKVEGAYTLTASRASQKAVHQEGPAGLTYFTKIFAEVVRDGIPGAGVQLTLKDIHKEIAARFLRLDLPDGLLRPEPSVLAVDTAEDLAFARNASAAQQEATATANLPGPVGTALLSPPGAVAELRDDVPYGRQTPECPAADWAERIAATISDPASRARAFAHVTRVAVAVDPDRAGRITDQAENIATTITDPGSRASVLAEVAWAVAAADPDRAERIAATITDPEQHTYASSAVAEVVAAVDPDRAERIAKTITTVGGWRESALRSVAEVVAAVDPDRAERIAIMITNPDRRVDALARIAAAVAALDPDRARHIAKRAEHTAATITDPDARKRALHHTALAVAAVDPDRAERAAATITDPRGRAGALAKIAAVVDPSRARRVADRAEGIAATITDPDARKRTLCDVARVVTAVDPDRAERITAAVTDPLFRAHTLAQIAAAVAALDPDRARRVADQAERAAATITDPRLRDTELAKIAEAVMAADPDQAERIAAMTTAGLRRDQVLAVLVERFADSAAHPSQSRELGVKQQLDDDLVPAQGTSGIRADGFEN